MLSQSVSLPFSIVNAYEGLAQVNGIVRVSEAGLVIEFEVKDGLLGVLRSGVKEVLIPIDELASLDMQRFWLFTRLIIRARSLVTLNQIPQSKSGQAVLWSVGGRNREIAERLIQDLRLKMIERESDRLNQEIRQLDDPDVSEVPQNPMRD
jgi:hypothetical protein